jgi:RNA polymerase sigma factor (sigma-70 family)
LTEKQLTEHFFRHEYGRIVATLVRRLGPRKLEIVEDAVQAALTTALESWKVGGVPANPSAWVFRVAENNAIGELRQRALRGRILGRYAEPVGLADEPNPRFADEVQDDLLRMLFACCADDIPVESQLVFALKTLCGFDVREIAHRLFVSEANVYKRLSRARSRLRLATQDVAELDVGPTRLRSESVRSVLYLLFTEGYLSSHPETAIRRELCEEAIRLATALAEHPAGCVPETCALLALMHMHVARLPARQDAHGRLLLLHEQDRSLWDQTRIRTGLEWLARSAQGEVFTRYHAEAGIAAEHCLAPTFAATRWQKVAEYYALLEQQGSSALHALNRAVAVAEWKGADAALEILAALDPPAWLRGSYLWAAVMSDLHRRSGHMEDARRYLGAATALVPTAEMRALLERRFNGIQEIVAPRA